MPPIFGIIHTGQGNPDTGILHNIVRAATYKVSREIIVEDINKGWFGAAIKKERTKETFLVKNDSLTIIADATLYHRKALIQRLEKDINPEASDARLILEAYIKWGSACVNFLYGDFAFVITDPLKDEIFCARDHMGIRPLFYTVRKGQFIFASELRLVLSTFEKTPDVDKVYFWDTILTRISGKDRTPFSDIHRLEPGHFFIAERGKRSVCQYWNPDPSTYIKLSDSQEYIQMFRELLVNAVQERCNTKGNIGTELSGGLDSSAVTGIAADFAAAGKIPLTAFSNVAPAESGIKDERDFIDKMLSFKKIDSVRVDSLDGSLTGSLSDAVRLHGCYIQQVFSIFSNGLYKAASEKNTEVLLSGFGGDELASARVGIPWAELIDEGRFGIIASELCHAGSVKKTLKNVALLIPRYIKSKFNRQESIMAGFYSPHLATNRYNILPIKYDYAEKHELLDLFNKKYVRKWRKKLSEKQLDSIFQDHIAERLEYCYTAAAQYGIEYRYPLLDPNLILVCLSFPPWLKFHHGKGRYLFREAIRGFVPENIRLRDDKSGGTIPQTFHYLVNEREQIISLIKKISGDKSLSEIFDQDKTIIWYDKLIKRDVDEINYLMPGGFYRYLMIVEYLTAAHK